MAQKLQSVDDSSDEQNEEGETRGPKSTIVFPYGDLDMGVDVVSAIWREGGQQCTIEQLAAWLKHESVTSGAFRLKCTTARIFGLIEINHDEVRLTRIGCEIVNPQLERKARVDAFLHVPLYKALYEKYKGYTLPQDIGLEREMEGLGVTPGQKNKARQAFQRSAQQAGFFEQGRNRLVLPSGLGSPNASMVSRDTKPLNPPPSPITSLSPQFDHGGNSGGGNSSGTKSLQDHPLVQGLFQELAPIDEPWTQAQHDEWIELAKLILKRIHPISQ
jgi:hypothetical protein